MFVKLGHETIIMLQKPKASQFKNISEPLKLENIELKTPPCFLINLNYNDIIIMKGINDIERLCKHMNHQIHAHEADFAILYS
jgi:hypothetical protein